MVTLNVLTKIVTPTITLLTKQLECNAIGRKYKIRKETLHATQKMLFM